MSKSDETSAPSSRSDRDLDKFDLAILTHLQQDARLTNADLAERVGLSPAPCWRRVRRLEQEGYILGYHAELDRRKIGLGVIAFVRLFTQRISGSVVQEIQDQLLALPQVLTAHHISGEGTFEIMVAATDLDAYAQFVREVLVNLPHIQDVRTSFSLGLVKNARELPLNHLY